MKQLFLAAFSLFLIIPPGQAGAASKDDPHPQVSMKTNFGEIVLELDRKKAPQTVANFIRYVENDLYNGTIFHRVIKDFMIQGGGFSADFIKKTTFDPIMNEADNGLKNDRGTIAMARTSDPHSATSQFFINVVDNDFLNYSSSTMQGWGYTVFGKVIKGMDVVDKIRNVPTGSGGPFPSDVPEKTVLIESVSMIPDDKQQQEEQ